MTNEINIITVDGSSGVGKGTLSMRLAQHYNLHLLDSGAIYRALAIAVVNENIAFTDKANIYHLATHLPLSFQIHDQALCVYLAQQDITRQLRLEKTGNDASVLAQYDYVRSALLEFQRCYAIAPGLVADGRDMGTTVFPNAQKKLFLTAQPIIRAQRRYKELLHQNVYVKMSALIAEINERDQRDQSRSISPLTPALDAHIIDTSGLTADQVFENACQFIDQ